MKEKNHNTKLALIAPYPPPYGGMSVLAETLSAGLGAHGLEILRIDTNWKTPKIIGSSNFLLKIYQTLLFFVQVPRLMRCDAALFVSGSGGSFFWKIVPAALVCRIFRVATILDFVGGGVEAELVKRRKLWKRGLSLFCTIIVPTNLFRDIFSRYGINSTVLPHMVAVERFSIDKSLGSKHVLLAAKNLVPHAGIDSIIRAFREVRLKRADVELIIAGEGHERKNFECLVAELGLSDVTFIGNISYSDMPSLFNRATLFVHGTKYESFGIVLVEAFASGTPVVSSNVGGIPEVVPVG